MADGLLKRLDERIAGCDAEVDRLTTTTRASIAAVKGQRDLFVKAKAMLDANPDAEAVLNQLKQLGVW